MLYILDRNEKIVGMLQNSSDRNKNIYYDDVLKEMLTTGAETLNFTAIPDRDTSKHLIVGNYIAFKKHNKFKLMQIIEVDETREDIVTKDIYCESAGLELINTVYSGAKMSSVNVKRFFDNILQDTNWQVGYVDEDLDKTLSINVEEKEVYNIIQEHLYEFEAEIEFRVDIRSNIVVGRYIDIYYKRGKKNIKRLEIDKDIKSISRKVSLTNFATKLIGEGKNGLTFRDISMSGEINKPRGQNFVINEEAYSTFNNKGKHITRKFKYDTEDATELLRQTYKALAEYSTPKITYEIDADILDFDSVEVGDHVSISDMSFEPPLLVVVRVKELQTSKTNKSANKAILTNQNEIKSGISSIFPITGDNIVDGTIGESQINPGFTNQVVSESVSQSTIVAQELVADKATIGDLTAINAKIENLTVDVADIGNLKADVAEINELLAGNITADNIQAGSITAGSGVIADGAIGDAQISSVNANKINAGEIDTSKVRVTGQDGFLFIENNTLFVVDNDRQIRVELGSIEEATNYGLIVRGSDGQTILMDHNGVKNAGITDGAVDNRTVSENANISGKKLDINSVVRSINEDGSVKITGTVIQVGEATLDVKLSEQNNLITEQGEKLENQQSQITANTNAINLKVDNQTYQSDKEGINTQLKKHTSEIELLQDEISLKIDQTDIDKVKDEVSGSIDTKIEESLSEIKITTDEISQKVETVASNQSKADDKLNSLEAWKKTAEQKITDEAIINTVSSSYYKKGETDKKYASQSQITQLSNQISSKVDANGVNSIIKQNPDSIRIGFNGIDNRTQIDTNGLSMYNPSGIKTTMLKLGNIYQYNGATGTFLGGYLSARNSSSNNLGVVGGYYTKQWIVSRSSGWQNDNDNNPSGVTDYFFVNFVDTGGNRTGIHLASNTYAHSSIQMQGNDIINAGVMNANVSKFRTWRDTSNVIAMDCNPDGKIYLGKHINTNGFSVSNNSDSRLKQDIKYVDETTYNLEEGREENLKSTLYKEFKDKFKFATYKYKREELKDKEHFGFMAQDLLGTAFEKYLIDNPNSACSEDDYLRYDLTELTTIIGGVLQEEISVRDKQIADLEERIKNIEKLLKSN